MTLQEAVTPLGELVADRLSRARVFERYGLDYCCGGKTPLNQACAAKGIDLKQVLQELAAAETQACTCAQTDWTHAAMVELVDHIVATHHAYLKRELPRLAGLVKKVAAVHGPRHPELAQVALVFDEMQNELELHMLKEEKILFPAIRRLETVRVLPNSPFASINNPVSVMEQEHAAAGAALGTLRRLTNDYTPPADACLSFKAMLEGLEDLESDLHLHVHKENNVLFPRACALEAALREEVRAGA